MLATVLKGLAVATIIFLWALGSSLGGTVVIMGIEIARGGFAVAEWARPSDFPFTAQTFASTVTIFAGVMLVVVSFAGLFMADGKLRFHY